MKTKIPINLKGFKHVKSDEETTTLQHPAGHTITLTHKALNPENQAQLKALRGAAQQAETPAQAQEAAQQSPLAKGGRVNPSLQQSKKMNPHRQQTMPMGQSPAAGMISNAAPFADGGILDDIEAAAQKAGDAIKQATGATGVQQEDISQQKFLKTPSNTNDDQPQAEAEGGDIKGNPKLEESQKTPPENTLDYSQFKRRKSTAPAEPLNYAKLRGEYAIKNNMPKKMYADPQGPIDQDDGAPIVDSAVPQYTDPMASSQGQQDQLQTSPMPQPTPQNVIAEPPDAGLTDDQRLRKNYNKFMQSRQPYGAAYYFTPKGDDPYGNPPSAGTLPDVLHRSGNVVDSENQDKTASDILASRNQQQTDADRARAGLPSTAAPDNTVAMPDASPQPEAQDTAPASIQTTPPTKTAPDVTNPDYLAKQGINLGVTAAQGMAKATQQSAQLEQDALQKAAEAKQSAIAAFQNESANNNKEYTSFINDVHNGYIDPEQYWKGDPTTGEGSHSKLMTGIGMILAGFTPNGAPNAAVDFLKYQMGKNMEAQAKNLDSKQNILRANIEHFRNLKDAADMTNVMQNGMAAYQIQKAAAQSKSLTAQPMANQAIGQIYRDNIQTMLNLNMRRALMNLNNNPMPGADPDAHIRAAMDMMDAQQPGAAASYRARFVPGYGISPDKDVPEDIRQELIAKKNYDQKAREYISFVNQNKDNWRNLDPQSRINASNTGAAMALNLQQLYRQKIHGGVYKEGEQQMIEKAIPSDPAAFSASFQATPRVAQTIKDNASDAAQLAEGYRLRPPTWGAPTPRVVPGVTHTVQTINGKQYYVPIK